MSMRFIVILALVASLAGCGSFLGGRGTDQANPTQQATRVNGAEAVAVNRYLWRASLEVLNFLPIETVDPFTGVIQTGFGTPPGSGRAYRATVLVSDPALDARSLSLSLLTRSGPVNPATVREVENAILTRARQLRVADRGL
ncbi:MAG: DUF3576 domain-containing protein [Shimia sp.]